MGSVSCPFCLDFVTIDKFISILLQFLPYFLIFDIRFEAKEHHTGPLQTEIFLVAF